MWKNLEHCRFRYQNVLLQRLLQCFIKGSVCADSSWPLSLNQHQYTSNHPDQLHIFGLASSVKLLRLVTCTINCQMP